MIACATVAVLKGSFSSDEPSADTETAGDSVIGASPDDPAGAMESVPDYTGILVISELMPKNKATMVNGRLDDWVEIRNLSDKQIALDGWRLKCEGSSDLSGTVIRPGEYLLLFS